MTSPSVVHVERPPLLEVQIEESQPQEIEEIHHKRKGFIVRACLQSSKDKQARDVAHQSRLCIGISESIPIVDGGGRRKSSVGPGPNRSFGADCPFLPKTPRESRLS
ncbi:hypothetical protein ARMSODRAFT_958458 [Armillaria solidipes]|uniref:Uncharacterized protein n=1 Tax=Armillaria solidipes TaxID=1076256 RepID=A0A2H3BUV6_9AGAR|nr:hypothetical protein ARMSODRAFT_958458 [Armillaria solidipes]